MKKLLAILLIFAVLCGFGTIGAAAIAAPGAEAGMFSAQADASTNVGAADLNSDINEARQRLIDESRESMIKIVEDRNKKHGLLDVIWNSILSFFGLIFVIIF